MLKEVADIKKRCESVEKSAREKLSNASTAKERNIQYYTIGAVNDIKISTTLDAFAEHVRNNLGTVKTLKIGTDEANEYIRSIMGDTLTVNRSFDEDIIRVDLHVFDASFACEAVSPGKEWEAIAKIWKYHRPYEPEETADIVTAVYEKAEKLGSSRRS